MGKSSWHKRHQHPQRPHPLGNQLSHPLRQPPSHPPKTSAKRASRKHVYKLPLEVEVAQTLSKLSDTSGYPVRVIMRLAIDHLINVWAPHYGIDNAVTTGVKLPPTQLVTERAIQAQPIQNPFSNPFQTSPSTPPYKPYSPTAEPFDPYRQPDIPRYKLETQPTVDEVLANAIGGKLTPYQPTTNDFQPSDFEWS
ncbi:hypothetical protein [Pelistega indica]|uniref:hypothetical protein n=1 Tax=Pelistega indica TaxID=1414851 RepID=UPI0011CC51B8|nr:hypothetical protein [Pelistega indica]